MPKILANDGIDKAGKQILEAAGIHVETNKIAQEDLMKSLNDFDGILVRSATTVIRYYNRIGCICKVDEFSSNQFHPFFR